MFRGGLRLSGGTSSDGAAEAEADAARTVLDAASEVVTGGSSGELSVLVVVVATREE